MNIKIYLYELIYKWFKMGKSESQVGNDIVFIKNKSQEILKALTKLKEEGIYDDDFIEAYIKTISRFNEDVNVLQNKSKVYFTNLKIVKKMSDFNNKK